MADSSGRPAGRNALVTGAGTGIGKAVALAFAREGAPVGLLGRRREKLEETAAEIAAIGGKALVLPTDVGKEAEVEAAVAAIEDAWGPLRIVVGVAGIELYGRGDDRVDRLSLETWERTINANLTGMFLTMKHGTRSILRGGVGGCLIVTGSPTGIRGHAFGEFAYSSSKAGTHGMVRQMACELAEENIRVNCVIPGMIATPINDLFFEDKECARRGERQDPDAPARPGRGMRRDLRLAGQRRGVVRDRRVRCRRRRPGLDVLRPARRPIGQTAPAASVVPPGRGKEGSCRATRVPCGGRAPCEAPTRPRARSPRPGSE